MLKKYSIKKIGYHPDRMKILKVGTAYLRKYLDAGYTKREALKQSNLDAAHHIQSYIGSHKGIKALPINFKGKFLGFAFSILNQFDIYGKVAAEFYSTAEDKFMFAINGSAASVESAINNLYGKVLGGTNQMMDDRDRTNLKKDITKFLKQVNSEVKNYNSKNNIPAEKKIIKHQETEKIITPMAHRKKTANKKAVKRKSIHTVEGKVKAYRRKATVKAHTRLVAGIGNINSVSLNYDELKRILQTQLLNREKLQKSVKSNYFSKEHNAVNRRLIKEYGLWIAHTKQKMNEEKKLLKKLIQ